jgi:hypothetical protein
MQARQAQQERQKADQAAAQESVCKQEQSRLDQLTARGSSGSGLDDLRSFARTVTCPRLGGVVVATIEKFSVETRRRVPNSPEVVRDAQSQLARLGCFTGKMDGSLTTTQDALGRYRVSKGVKATTNDVTQAVVDDLARQSGRVCPLQCEPGETAKGDMCIANAKPSQPPATASRKDKDKDEDTHRKQANREREREQASRERERERERERSQPARPAAPQQAYAPPPRPVYSGGGMGGGGGGHSGGGHSAIVGVGF